MVKIEKTRRNEMEEFHARITFSSAPLYEDDVISRG